MRKVRRHKLQFILLIMTLLSLASAFVLYALRQNISLFYAPTQVAQGEAPSRQLIRVGGMVVPGSVKRKDDLQVIFKITDYQHSIIINYKGILPDLFREGQGIVAKGELMDRKHFHAHEVLAKHDENYMPPEVKSALASSAPSLKGRNNL